MPFWRVWPFWQECAAACSPAGQTEKNGQSTFWQGQCTPVKRTWGRARCLMNVRYFAHHVVQYDCPARLWWCTAMFTIRVSGNCPQNEPKWPFWAPKRAFQAISDKSACKCDRSLPCGAQNDVFFAQGSTKSHTQSPECIQSHEGSTQRGQKGARMRQGTAKMAWLASKVSPEGQNGPTWGPFWPPWRHFWHVEAFVDAPLCISIKFP